MGNLKIVGGVALLALFVAFVVFVVVGRGFRTGRPSDSAWVAASARFERYVEVEGVRVRALDTGGSGPAILLLHGWADSTHTWSRIIPLLSDRFRLVAFDWPGFGWSDKPADPFPFPRYAKVAAGVLDKMGIEKAFVAGNSMGGAAAMRFAIDFPSRVAGLILLDAHTPLSAEGKNPALNSLLTPVVGEAGAWLMGTTIYRMVIEGLVFDKSLTTDAVVREMYLPVTSPGGRGSLLRQFREIVARPVGWEDTATITAPTLIIWGRKDRLTPRRAGERLHEIIKGSRLEILPDTGHVPQWEKPEDVARLVGEFVRSAR
ncbi:MAG: alpha/beta hydrolase [Deltaproteobacteria bacterium]|nr:alpha/beta hydrolase [Deltaproteobacteria bacterium]